MGIDYRGTRFISGAMYCKQLLEECAIEIAFAGRSNSGKSSTINILCGRKNLARTSKTPGRTQMINFYQVTPNTRLVDLPGYGYAKANQSMQRKWRSLLECYFRQRICLRGVILIMDIRHPLTPYDWTMLGLCSHRGYDIHILLNKADKLRYGKKVDTERAVARALNDSNITIQAFSASTGTGLQDLREKLDYWVDT